MADLAASDHTLTLQDPPGIRVRGRQRFSRYKTVFGDGSKTYPSGGVPYPTAANVGMQRSLESIELLDAESGGTTVWKTDYANKTFRGYKTADVPLLVVEEVVTVASNIGTLEYPPAYIIAVEVTAGGSTPVCHVIPTGETVSQSEVAVTFPTGVLTFNATDAVTSVRVTYIPQQLTGPFSASNMIIDEEITMSATPVSLANRALCVQYVWDDTGGARLPMEPDGEQPASGQCSVAILDTTTKVDFHADEATGTAKVTYLKYSGLDNTVTWLDSVDRDVSAGGTFDLTALAASGGILVPGLGTQAVMEVETSGANEEAPIAGPSGTVAEGVVVWDPIAGTIDEDQTDQIDHFTMHFFILHAGLEKRTGLRELNSTAADAPASTTLYLEASGW